MTFRDRFIIAFCRRSWRFYGNVCTSVMLEVKGQAIRVPLVRNIGLRNLSFSRNTLNPTYKENWILRMIGAIYSYRSGGFVDVGANIGKVLINLMLYDRTIPYWAFEPNVNCCFYLNRLIAENGLRHHALLPVGLSDQAGVATLTFSSDFDVSASAVDGFRVTTGRQSTQIMMDRGDRFLSRDRVAVIKFDVEGGELAALRGLSETIGRCRPVLLLEILDFGGMANKVATLRRDMARGIAEFLTDRDYALFRMGSDLELSTISLEGLADNLHAVENNYIAVPKQEVEELRRRYSNVQL